MRSADAAISAHAPKADMLLAPIEEQMNPVDQLEGPGSRPRHNPPNKREKFSVRLEGALSQQTTPREWFVGHLDMRAA